MGFFSTSASKNLQKSEKTTNKFKVGTRVKLDPPIPTLFACVHGIVVNYKGKHSPTKPRVRWDSGFGTTIDANKLKGLTAEEYQNTPQPKTIPEDGI
jgi:hypothetical protein